jgi:hypothetical protein
MTESELAEIEAAVGFLIPSEYRRVAIEFPFRHIGRDSVYWFYDEPERVIGGTLFPLANAAYDRTGWKDSYLVIGESAAGDPYLMDTIAAGYPVFCLCHESHRIEKEYPTFSAFVEDWSRAPDRVDAELAEEKSRDRAEWTNRILRTIVFVILAIPVSLIFAWLVSWMVLWFS